MKLLTFREYMELQEGVLLPNRPPATGLPRLNTTPAPNAHRLRTRPVAPPQPVRRTAQPVTQVVPPNLVAKVK